MCDVKTQGGGFELLGRLEHLVKKFAEVQTKYAVNTQHAIHVKTCQYIKVICLTACFLCNSA